MATDIIVVENRNDWRSKDEGNTVITAREYITEKQYVSKKPTRVINLCRDYNYLSVGYYCSLLAEARGHKVIPSVKTMLDLGNRTLYHYGMSYLEDVTRVELADKPPAEDIHLYVYFGYSSHPDLKKLAAKIFDEFRCPLIRVKLHYRRRWKIKSIRPQSINSMRVEQHDLFIHSLNLYTKQRWSAPKIKSIPRYDLAILHNSDEQFPPSDHKALDRFVKVGKAMDINVELITKKDFARLFEFDALFIRETTGIDHHTFRFAKKADREGMVVIDDPVSIFRCANKVYLAELLKTNKIKTPKTIIFDYNGIALPEQQIEYPMVLKIPDGSFSRGVHRVHNRREHETICSQLLQESDIILAQEYLYTDYDWRIGILNNQPIFACQYFMTKKHWQIIKHGNNGQYKDGNCITLPIAEVPIKIVETAVKAAGLIGNGFYGVDLKERDGELYLIEVNDNPNLDHGVEDAYLKDELYRIILQEFIRRLNHKWSG